MTVEASKRVEDLGATSAEFCLEYLGLIGKKYLNGQTCPTTYYGK